MTIVVWVLLVAAAAVTLLSAVGAALMRDPLQRLHYVSPPSTLGVALVAAAFFVGEHDKDVALKAAFVGVALAVMNGVISHATARATRVHDVGKWQPTRNEHVPLRGGGEVQP